MFTRKKGERERDRERERDAPFRRRKNPRPPMLSLPRSNSIKVLPSKTGRIEEETACGVMWSVSARRGRRRTHREDMYTVLPFITDSLDQPVSVFAIFDGHGGRGAAEYASKRLPDVLLQRLGVCGDVKQSLEQAFQITDAEVVAELAKMEDEQPKIVSVQSSMGRKTSSLFSRKSRAPDFGESPRGKSAKGCGCTATVVVMVGNKLNIAHVGDSGAVLSTKQGFRRLCEDHRPGRPDEQQRIESCGGLVLEICGTPRVNGVLAVSRSIGDAGLKEFVIAKPEVREVILGGDEEFVVLATDGLWDVVTDEESVEVVKETLCKENGEEQAVKRLVERAWDRGSNDDTCVLVINLVKYAKVYARDVVDAAEFLSPDGNNNERANNGFSAPATRINDPPLPVAVELVTPHAHVVATPRLGKKTAWE